MDYIIRTASPADFPRLNRLFKEMLCAIYGTESAEGYKDGELDYYFSGSEDRIYAAEAEGRIVAYLSVEVHREDKCYLYYDDFCVDKSHRGTGVGTALINEAERFCRSIGFEHTTLHVEKSNTAARKFYENKGFEIHREDGSRLFLVKHIN